LLRILMPRGRDGAWRADLEKEAYCMRCGGLTPKSSLFGAQIFLSPCLSYETVFVCEHCANWIREDEKLKREMRQTFWNGV
jgi:hypothetical protein